MAEKAMDVKHINPKVAGADPKLARGKDAKPVFMCRIFGIVEGVKGFEDRKSGDLKNVFVGDFRAQGADGKLYQSDKMFVFKQLEEKLSSTFKSGGEKAIEFAYDLSAIPDDKSATGYIYTAKSIIPTATNDRLAKMTQQIGEHALPNAEPEEQAQTKGEPAGTGNGEGEKKGKK